MVKYLSLGLLLFPITLIAQLKHDANWVFGYNCGLNIDSIALPFTSKSGSIYVTSTYSDMYGQLQLYFSGNEIRDSNDSVIFNGDSILAYNNGVNAFVGFKNKVWFISSYTFNRSIYESWLSNNLAYSIIEKDNNDWAITKKNIRISTSKPVDDRMVIVQHANGKDWWLLMHEGFTGDIYGFPPAKSYFRFLITEDSIIGPEIQQIGGGHPWPDRAFGDVAISKSGNLIAFSITYSGIIELYDFDRCTGLLSNLRTIYSPSSIPIHRYYGIEFSPSERFLYVTTGRGYEVNSLYQLDLTQSNFTANATRLWYSENIDSIRVGNLRLGADGKIYMASYINDLSYGIHNKIGVINKPDSMGLASNFMPFDFELNSDCRVGYWLPLIPNYNLNGIPVHMADAGNYTFFCEGDSTIKGVTIGGDSVQGVIYEWLPAPGIDSLNATSHIVKPDSSRWYYVSITDTNYNGNYSCYSRLDSVFVEVKNCADTTNIIDTTHIGISELNFSFAVYPNPTTNSISVETNLALTNLAIYSITGNLIYNYQSPNIPTLIDISGLENGVYLISGQTLEGKRQFMRFVKMNGAN